jgi:spore coat polysaccharide biosynthesis protein SpsF
VDTPEDYNFICSIYDVLYPKNKFFGLSDIFRLMEQKPWLREINQQSQHKKIHTSLESELNEVIEYCEKQDLKRVILFINDNIER